MVDLQDLRNEIDSIDRQMTELFEKRMEISRKVAKYKISTGKKVFDKEREKKVIEKAKDMTHNDFNRHGIEELFQQIMAMSRKLQYQLLEENGVAGRLPFIGVDELEKENVRVVFQGVEGAYSQAAMQQYFGDKITSFHVEHWRDAMEAIQAREDNMSKELAKTYDPEGNRGSYLSELAAVSVLCNRRIPAAAARTKAEVVEMLKVPTSSPPVPTISMTSRSG